MKGETLIKNIISEFEFEYNDHTEPIFKKLKIL